MKSDDVYEKYTKLLIHAGSTDFKLPAHSNYLKKFVIKKRFRLRNNLD